MSTSREHYVPTSELIVQAMEAGIAYEETQLPVHLAVERGLRKEITRRHKLNWCDICGCAGVDCECIDTANGPNVVFVNEFEHEGAA